MGLEVWRLRVLVLLFLFLLQGVQVWGFAASARNARKCLRVSCGPWNASEMQLRCPDVSWQGVGDTKHVQKWRVLECGNRARTDASTDASSWLLSVFLFRFLNLQNCESSGLLVTVAVRLCCCGLSLSLCQGVTRSSRGRRVCEPGPGLRACSTDFTKDRSKSIRNPQGLNHRPPQHKSPDTSKPSRPKRRACWHDGCFLQPGPAVDAQEVQRLNSGFRAPGT